MSEAGRLLDTVRLGIEAEAFVQSEVGRKLVARAREHAETAVERLKTVDPCDHLQIMKLQNQVWQGESFERFLAELVQDGWQAEEILRQAEE